jgi:hypothetical protein
MLHSAFVRRTFSLIVLFVLTGAESAEAQEPFFYYPAYGSNRGRIRYVDGVLRDKQRIKWGNGVTDNGVLMMRDIATAAQQILPAVLNNAPAPTIAEENHARAAHSLARAQDEQLQARAEEILEANRKLLEKLGGSPGPAVPPVTPTTTGKLQVLFLHESEDLAEYTPEQVAVINSNKIRMYLNTHCDKINGDPQWRRLDNDVPKNQLRDENVETWWERIEETKAKSGEKLWLVIYKDGIKVHDQEVTSDEEETLELLQSFGGN